MAQKRKRMVISEVAYGTVEPDSILTELLQILQSQDALPVGDGEPALAQPSPDERGED